MDPNPVKEALQIRQQVVEKGQSDLWDAAQHPNPRVVEQHLGGQGIGFQLTHRDAEKVEGYWVPMPGGTRHFVGQTTAFGAQGAFPNRVEQPSEQVLTPEEIQEAKLAQMKASRLG